MSDRRERIAKYLHEHVGTSLSGRELLAWKHVKDPPRAYWLAHADKIIALDEQGESEVVGYLAERTGDPTVFIDKLDREREEVVLFYRRHNYAIRKITYAPEGTE